MRILILFLLVGSVAQAQVTEQPFSLRSTGFLSFKIHGQTLPTAIHNLNRKVKIEVAPDVDLANVVPSFEVSEGHSVYVDGVQQISGITAVDFSKEVTYQIKNNGNAQTTIWTASAIPLSCRILIDVSHDGGSWSSPQPSTHFDQNQRHQGKAFADLLRSKGFEVNELGAPLTEEMFFGHYIVIRAGGFHTYTPEELKVYASLLDRGMNLVFLTGPKKNSPVDELGERLGIRFEGVASGRVTTFASDELTKNLISIGGYNGSALTNLDSNPNIKVLGWLGSTDFGDINMNSVKDPKEQTAPPVMGVLTYSKSKVFFIGDTVAIQTTPQPFVDNLVKWMLGSCFESGLRLVGSVGQAQVAEKPGFLSFKIHGQTLPTAIHNLNRKVKIEVAPGVDLANVVPSFEVSEGDSVYVDGVQQISGITAVDFTKEVTYQIKGNGNGLPTIWTASAVPLGCRILIDVSHDGGSWSGPQLSTHFDQNQPHQGKAFADLLRSKGFEVNELGAPITEEMFFGYYIVIRASGFHTYTPEELKVYVNLLDRGMNLVFLTGHKRFDPVDELGEHLGIRFEGVASGRVTTFTSHEITQGVISIDDYEGSVLTNLDSNPNIKVLGWLGSTDFGDINMNSVKDPKEQTAPPVMGVLTYSKSKVFFIGDTRAIQTKPQPFVDNLVKWMLGSCFESGLRP